MDMEDADAFNDYNYWRLPPPVINEPATNEAPCRDDVSMDEDEETYSDFNFWRAPPPPSDLRALGLEQQSVATPQRPASPRREYLEVPTPDDVDSDNEDGGDDDDPMTALSGGAGARLLGLLGQLSAHLGSSSRFARAAGLLQEDMMRQRESMMQAQQSWGMIAFPFVRQLRFAREAEAWRIASRAQSGHAGVGHENSSAGCVSCRYVWKRFLIVSGLSSVLPDVSPRFSKRSSMASSDSSKKSVSLHDSGAT